MSNLKYLLVCVLIYRIDNIPSYRFKKEEDCKDTVAIKQCTLGQDTVKLYRSDTNQMLANFESNCDFDEIKYHWSTFSEADPLGKEYLGGNIFTIEPFELKKDNYVAIVRALVTRNGKESKRAEDGCPFDMVALEPIPVIVGGSERTVPANQAFALDASQSVNRDTEPMAFKWTCQADTDFCKKQHAGSKWEVPATYAVTNRVFAFTLNVKNVDSDHWLQAEQTVKVLQETVQLDITCEKNCPPVSAVTNAKKVTYLRVKSPEKNFEWTIDVDGFDYEKSTKFGRHSDRFIIKEDVLKEDKTYKIDVRALGKEGKAAKLLKVSTSLQIETCKVDPLEGTAFETEFKITCKTNKQPYIFEVVTKDDSVVLTRSNNIDKLSFVLPANNAEVYVNVWDVNCFHDSIRLSTNVKASTLNTTTIINLIDREIKEENTEKAIQLINALMETSPEVSQLLLDKVQQLRMQTPDEEREISFLVGKMLDLQQLPHAHQAQIVTGICKRASELELEQKQRQRRICDFDSVQARLKCAEAETRANFKELEVDREFPHWQDADYPDYIDDYIDKKLQFEAASYNFVELCLSSLNLIGLDVAPGEGTVTVRGGVSTAQVTRLVGRVSELSVRFEGGTFQLSKDFANQLVDLMICTWQDDIFWWSKWAVNTGLVLVKVLQNNQQVRDFKQESLIVFDRKNKSLGFIEFETSDSLRIDVKADQGFTLIFPNGENISVTIRNFARNTGKVGKPVNNTLYVEETNGFDSWYYVYVSGVEKISVGVLTTACYRFESKQWKFACKGFLLDDSIYCKCYHLSILAGFAYDNHLKITRVDIEPFQMVLVRTFTIFFTLTIVVFVYCTLLVIYARQRQKTVNLYIPSDISADCRYAYLVGIRTGRIATTSNVCIRLLGSENKSKAHFLNYPDQERRIFRKWNLDWFLLPTLEHLGTLQEIDIWLDFSGRDPKWFCRDVTVYDLQENKEFWFVVQKCFELPPKGAIYYKIREGKKETRFWGNFICSVFPKWLCQDGFGTFRKLTFLFSIVLTTLFYCLLFYGMPTLRLKDGFDYEKYTFRWFIIWIGITVSCICYLIHFVFILAFRAADKRKIDLKYCWLFLTTIISTKVLILGIFAFWVPLVTSLFWLSSILVSLIVYFIFEHLYDIWVTYFGKNNQPAAVNVKRILNDVEEQRKILFRKFGANFLRAYFTPIYRPLDEDEIKERQHYYTLRQNFLAFIRDAVMFLIYITSLYIAVYANKNPLTILNHQELLSLVQGYHTGTQNTPIESINDIYVYVNDTLLPTIHAESWYPPYKIKETGFMADFNNKLIGVARLRQRRHAKNFTTHKVPKRLAQAWQYCQPKKCGYTIYTGSFGIYDGGGFVGPLGRTWYNSHLNLLQYQNGTWLDEKLTALFIEFLAYNVNSNLFGSVRIVFERGGSGFLAPKFEVTVSQFLFVSDKQQRLRVFILLTFVAVVGAFSVGFLARFFKNFKDVWIWVDVLILILTFASILLFVHRAEAVGQFLDEIEKAKKNQFIHYFQLFHEDLLFTIVAAFLIFIATVRLWKMCRYGKVFKVMEKTVVVSVLPILLILFLHLVLLTAYTSFSFMVFGSFIQSFSHFFTALSSLLLMLIGFQDHVDFDLLTETSPTLGSVFYLSYMFLNLLFLTIYIAIIIMSLYEAQIINIDEPVKKLFVKEMAFYRTYAKILFARLKAGSTASEPFVTPKPDELRYAGCLTMAKTTLICMFCVAAKIFEQDRDTLMKVVVSSIDCEDVEIFYGKRNEKNVIRLIYDGRVRRVAAVAEKILSKKREELMVKRLMRKRTKMLNLIGRELNKVLGIVNNIEVD